MLTEPELLDLLRYKVRVHGFEDFARQCGVEDHVLQQALDGEVPDGRILGYLGFKKRTVYCVRGTDP